MAKFQFLFLRNISDFENDKILFLRNYFVFRDIPIFGTTHADHLTSDIPCAPPMKDDYIQGDYEHMTGYQIIDCLKERGFDHNEVEMILVGNHAPFTWGKTAHKAVYNSAVCEEVAKMAHLTLQINPNAKQLKEALKKKPHDTMPANFG